VRWEVDGHPLALGLMLSGNPRTKSFGSFLTNLPPHRYPLEVICRAYKWRWQVAFVLKEWKSSATLHAFETAKAAIVAGRMWAALAAAARTRLLAHMPHLLAGVSMSTRKVALGALHV
jgi:hypothetical protein